MKKSVICLFSLILYVLLACLLLSLKIETEMMSQVKISERENKGDSFGFNQSVLFSDNDGTHLYEVVNGTGWDSGLLAQKLPASWYIDIDGKVQFTGNKKVYRFVYSASRTLQDGEKVAIVEEFEKGQDLYLYLYENGIPEEYVLPKNAELVTKSENALLLNMAEAESPFFEQTALSLTETTKQADRVFSLAEVTQFLEQIPLLVVVCGVFIAGVIFWGIACLFSLDFEDNKRWVWLNIGLVCASLVVMAIMLTTIDLPASMMPADSIFNLPHFKEELSIIANTLKTFSDTTHDFFSVKERAITLAAITTGCIAILIVAIPFTEGIIFRYAYRSSKENAEDKADLS